MKNLLLLIIAELVFNSCQIKKNKNEGILENQFNKEATLKSGPVLNDLSLLKWARDAQVESFCRKKMRIVDYEPFHIRYQFGHYPARKPYTPGDEDWRLLDLYAEWGGGIIHLWWWNDLSGLSDKSPFEALNEEGTLRFIEEAHKRGLKVIPYISPGYFDIQKVMYDPKWSRNSQRLVSPPFDFDLMCPGSTSWRKYFLGNVEKMLVRYNFDGIYWDGGIGPGRPGCANSEAGDHIHFIEADPMNSSRTKETFKGFFDLWEDFIAELYCIVRKHNGIIAAHVGGDMPQPFERKWWDYLLLGETIPDVLVSVDRTRDYEPYVMRLNDWSKLVTNWREKNLTPDIGKVPAIEHLSFAACMVYLQFPFLEDGSFGEMEDLFTIPGTKWNKEFDHWVEWMKVQQKIGLKPLFGASWIAGRERHGQYLKVYRQMTQPNTVAYIEVKEQPKLPFPGSNGTRRVSLYINGFAWVAIANLGSSDETVSVKSLDGNKNKTVHLQAGRLTLLRYSNMVDDPEIIPVQ